MENIKISIIIPCYNVGLYVESCLQSILKQEDERVEIIIVNDGSTDQTKNIINNLASKYSKNITILHQENAGLSVARNVGLEIAKGDYLALLDGDDVVEPNYIEDVLRVIELYSPDIIEIDAYRFSSQSRESFKLCSFEKEKRIHSVLELEPVFNLSKWFAWGRIYSRNIIKGEIFEQGKRYEDIMFTPFLYLKAKRIYSINKPLLGYRYNPNSITKKIKKSDIEDIIYAIEKFSRQHDSANDENIKYLLIVARVRLFSYLKFISNNINGYYYSDSNIRILSKKILEDYHAIKNNLNVKINWKSLFTVRYFMISGILSRMKKMI
ncbi:glycosyltransferase [Hafnia paralvei]|uniref:glycosyltransferase n=1 Tax=Hafnia paralvei TaxID=546367 RepID=UPI000DF393D8|nr:glycosyltransferase [Hafnia paralvei]MBU2673993.1 glycosyltransferase [Hafnia paralvei]RDA70566.1 glycosyltransferase [Hafnia paralvei]RDA71395.1 glycosyltransferase [Hafnia paralvei]RDA71447.1 glycosyltransferase [Hafnia paralvei]RDA80632.1 glycosyltransferase [Hafnia paralvei]